PRAAAAPRGRPGWARPAAAPAWPAWPSEESWERFSARRCCARRPGVRHPQPPWPACRTKRKRPGRLTLFAYQDLLLRLTFDAIKFDIRDGRPPPPRRD